MSVTAAIASITRCSLHDGPGVRSVVYFKGCALRCQWCHNPETLSAEREVLFTPVKCIGCGHCTAVCPQRHMLSDGVIRYLREGCSACGACVESCPTGALALCGERMSAEEVYAEICKDRHYYDASGGGVTLSGGECLLYPDFVRELLRKCRENGIHTAVESAMFVPWENVERVMPYVDLFYVDLKHPDPDKHRIYTGQSNDRILANISRLSQRADNITIRIPVIPGVNDSQEDLVGFGEKISAFADGVKAVELLRYNSLAESKYQISGRKYISFAQEPQTDQQMRILCKELREHISKDILMFTKE